MVMCKINQECTHKTFSTPSCRISSAPSHSHKASSTPSHSHKAFSALQPQNSQQSFNVQDRYAEQIKLRREWEERIKQLTEKYKLDYYSRSESGSDSEPEPDYRYEHKYETLI